MTQLLWIKEKKKLLDGNMVPVNVSLGTTLPVVVRAIQFSTIARLILCETKQLQQKLLNTNYQFSHPVPDGVQLEVASNVYWKYFDLMQPHIKDDQRRYFIHPQKWAPVTLQSKTGMLYGVIEARCGNEKHKAVVEIALHI